MVNPFEILYEDDRILCISKPAGLQVHAMAGRRCYCTLVELLKKHFDPHPWPVHRLDRPTSGVMLLAFDKDSASILSENFREGKVQKTYMAVTRGWVDQTGTVDIPLKKMDSENLQEAITHYRRLHQWDIPVANNKFNQTRYSMVELKPQSGRYHQLRRHMARIAHPILGDTSHGDTRHNRIFAGHYQINRLMLHAWKLAFTHPISKELIEIEAPLPEEFLRLKEGLSKTNLI